MNIGNHECNYHSLIFIPPSQPSPTGERVKGPFPLGGNEKGGLNLKELILLFP
jgi:hypothetical protein